MNEYLENQLNKSVVYQQLKDNCERNNQHEVLALVAKVGTFAVTAFDPKVQIDYSVHNLLTAETEHTGGDFDEQ